MLDKSRKLIITHHAMDRATQFQVSRKNLVKMFWASEEEPKPPGSRHDNNGKVTIYRRNGTVVMVVGEAKNKYADGQIYLLITIFDQRMYLDSKHV